jgi:hypothetical protein
VGVVVEGVFFSGFVGNVASFAAFAAAAASAADGSVGGDGCCCGFVGEGWGGFVAVLDGVAGVVLGGFVGGVFLAGFACVVMLRVCDFTRHCKRSISIKIRTLMLCQRRSILLLSLPTKMRTTNFTLHHTLEKKGGTIACK